MKLYVDYEKEFYLYLGVDIPEKISHSAANVMFCWQNG